MTHRTEKIGDATLYLGDCREILPTLGNVDAVVTDPPYGIGRSGQSGMRSNSRGRINTRTHHPDLGWDERRPERATFDLLRKISCHQIIWGGNHFADFLPPTSKWLVWDKGQRINQSDGELAWTNSQGALRIVTIGRAEIGQDAACWRGPSYHPTQKPVALMLWCIEQIAPVRSVLDPYMGSGTTGVACWKRGARFIGIEREAAYFDIACRRIEEAYRQPRLFAEPPPKPKQGSFFDGEAA